MKIAVTSKSFSKNSVLIDALKEEFEDVKLNFALRKLTDDETIEFLKDCDGAIVALENINKYVLDNLPNLKVISKFGVGLDNIDLKYCQEKNVEVLWTKGVNSKAVAELALCNMLMLIRNVYISSNKLSIGNWEKSGGYSLFGKTVGIIGIGHIGKELVRLLQPFECKILANDIIEQEDFYSEYNLITSSKEEIFRQSDIISIHTPLNIETKFLINKNSLSIMKRNAIVINTARGDIINLNDLKFALKDGIIAGAAIDVYEQEPPQDKELLILENLVCTPHIGGNSYEAVIAMGMSAIENLKVFKNGNNK